MKHSIVQPLITEKLSALQASNKFAFEVDITATKLQIKKAVEELFKVEVTKVTTSIVKGKRKRNKRK